MTLVMDFGIFREVDYLQQAVLLWMARRKRNTSCGNIFFDLRGV